jgi:hypothetical protein
MTEVKTPKEPATGGFAYLDSVFECKVNRYVDCGLYCE